MKSMSTRTDTKIDRQARTIPRDLSNYVSVTTKLDRHIHLGVVSTVSIAPILYGIEAAVVVEIGGDL